MTDDYAAIGQWLARETGSAFDREPVGEVAGGSINHCLRWRGASTAVFLKTAPAALLPMFEAEAAGLRELASAESLRTPSVIGVASIGATAVLALEWLELRAASTSEAAHAPSRCSAGGAAPRVGPCFRLESRQHDRCDAAAERLAG